MSDPYEIVVTAPGDGTADSEWWEDPTNPYGDFGYNPYGTGDANYNPYYDGAGFNEDGLTAVNVPTVTEEPVADAIPNSTVGVPEGSEEDDPNDPFVPAVPEIEPYNIEAEEAEVNGGYTIDDWIYQGGGVFQASDGSTANAEDYGVAVDSSWETGGTYGVDETGNVVASDETTPDAENETTGIIPGPNTSSSGDEPFNGPIQYPTNDPITDDTTDNTIPDVTVILDGENSPEEPDMSFHDNIDWGNVAGGAASNILGDIFSGGGEGTGYGGEGGYGYGGTGLGGEGGLGGQGFGGEGGLGGVGGSGGLGGVGGVASAIGGAVNVSNQFDFLENSAEDQMMANRQAALDSSTLMNPNYTNPYGSQTTTPAYVDANGNLVQPNVNQSLNAGQQQLFDTETSIKQGLGDTALAGVGGVQDQFNNPYDSSGLIDRYQVDPSGIQDYSNIDLNALSGRNTQPGVTGRNAITDAMIQREQPRFDRAEKQMKNDLLIRGFNPGTEGFTEQTDEFGRAQNDFNLAAQAAGAQEQSRLFGLESALRGQQLNEQDTARVGNAQNREQQVGEQMDFGRYTSDERSRQLQEDLSLRNLPLNELNALRQGNQTTVPQFQGFSGTGVNAAPAYDAAQAQAQASGNYADGFFGLGGELLDWFGNRTAQPAQGA